jgi:glycosyltransferase involved in cell wall biosynthesis
VVERLSRGHDIHYIQPFGLRGLRLADTKRIIRRFLGLFRPSTASGIPVRNLFFVPSRGRRYDALNATLLRRQLAPMMTDQTVVWITTPSALIPRLLADMPRKALIYEMMDDYGRIHAAHAGEIERVENHLLGEADLVIVTSDLLLEKAERMRQGKRTVLIGNGVDYGFFDSGALPRPPELGTMGTVAGYIGAIDHWMDFETVAYVADLMRHVEFVFVGPVRIPNFPRRPNIHYLGRQPYERIPQFCAHFDVCLIPFLTGALADTVNPVKIYEYFSLGKPVVASRMKELEQFGDLVYLASGPEEFRDGLRAAFSEKSDATVDRRKEIAKKNDWSMKVAQVEKELLQL